MNTGVSLSSRTARTGDWKVLRTLCRESLPQFTDAQFSYHARNHLEGFRVFEGPGGEIAGYWLLDPGHGDDVAWLELIVVAPAFRGKGLGRFLLENFEAAAAEMGYPRAGLAVLTSNLPARNLYVSAGWNPSGQPTADGNQGYEKKLPEAPGRAALRARPVRPGPVRSVLRKIRYQVVSP